MPDSLGVDGQPPPLPRACEAGGLCGREVCPRCGRELGRYSFWVGEVWIETWSCAEHGDVQPPPRRGSL